jgi:hypothetical protein
MSRWGLLLLFLLGACDHTPLGASAGAGRGGSSSGSAGTGGTAGGSGLPVARIGDDGICGATVCSQGQQCCLSTGRCVAPSRAVADCPLPQPKPAICGGVTCASDQICCLLSGKCIDPSTAATSCPIPGASPTDASPTDASSTGISPNGVDAPCGSNADCPPTQFCSTTKIRTLCLGLGTCQSRSNCGSSSGAPNCGCDGVTYPDVQTACRAGIRIIAMNACGTPVEQAMRGTSAGPRDLVIYCATGGQCPQGTQCCAITNRCYDVSIPYLCTFPPPGTSLSCLEDRQCSGYEFCQGSGCSGEGGCVRVGSSICGGVLAPVCGCDGKTYTNPQCSVAAAVRTSHEGSCNIDAGAGP